MPKNKFSFIFNNLNLKNKTILDAATGAGRATYRWAEQIDKQGGHSRIISVDKFDLPGENEKEWISSIKQSLGEYEKYVDIKKGDIFNLHFLADNSIDIINCDNTIVFLNKEPLQIMNALKEFKRILKPEGILVIVSEDTFDDLTEKNQTQWKRWNLSKAIYNLNGKTWSTEPKIKNVMDALNIIGFKKQDSLRLNAIKNTSNYKTIVKEWKKIMNIEIQKIPFSHNFKTNLKEEVKKIYEKVLKEKYIMTFSYWILKAVLKDR